MKVSCQLHVLVNLHPRKPEVLVENCIGAPERSCMWKLKEIILASIGSQTFFSYYYIILYYIILYYIILYYIILYYIILYYIILYYIIL